jgi:hypothetical protein
MGKDKQHVELICHLEIILTSNDGWIPKARSSLESLTMVKQIQDAFTLQSYFEDISHRHCDSPFDPASYRISGISPYEHIGTPC